MLIERIRDDMIAARKGTDPVAKSLLVTLYAEATRVGKDKRNGATTDDECVAVIRKFSANSEETIQLLTSRGHNTQTQQQELSILQAYLPQQMTEQELAAAIEMIIRSQPERNSKIMGKVMAELKAQYGASYDGKIASQLVKAALT